MEKSIIITLPLVKNHFDARGCMSWWSSWNKKKNFVYMFKFPLRGSANIFRGYYGIAFVRLLPFLVTFSYLHSTVFFLSSNENVTSSSSQATTSDCAKSWCYYKAMHKLYEPWKVLCIGGVTVFLYTKRTSLRFMPLTVHLEEVICVTFLFLSVKIQQQNGCSGQSLMLLESEFWNSKITLLFTQFQRFKVPC